MSRRSLLLNICGALVAAVFAQQAAAWGTGGAVSSPFKTLANGNTLFCDLSDVNSTATTQATACVDMMGNVTTCTDYDPGNGLLGGGSGPFVFEGNVVCAEVLPTNMDPSLADAEDLPDCPDCIGLFTLKQKVMDGGLAYSGDSEGINGTWTFTVGAGLPDENLLWELTPAVVDTNPLTYDPQALKFCANPSDPDNCVAKFGLEEPEDAGDYTGGLVFSFTTISGVPQALNWAVCHNGAFDNAQDIFCEVDNPVVGEPPFQTRSNGSVAAIVEVKFEFSPTLNVKNKSKSSNINLKICGNDQTSDNRIVFDDSGSPLETDQPIKVTGTGNPGGVPIQIEKFSVNDANSGVCAGGGADLTVHLNRASVISAVTPCTGREATVMISGSLINNGLFSGMGTIAVVNCDK